MATKGPHCEAHAREYEATRGSKQSRGYDKAYDAARRRWAPKVLAGRVACWRCKETISPDEEWHLGHDDGGRIAGPEHASSCNLRAAGLKSKGIAWYPARPAPLSDDLRDSRADARQRADRAAQRRTARLRRLGREDEI